MRYLICILYLTVICRTAGAQADTILLEDFTISVTPFEERLSEATGSLSIINTNGAASEQTINIADQLNSAPGIFMSSGTYTTNRLTIRGIGSRTPYSSNRIKAYLEEIPLTGGDGISTLEDIDIMNISRVEIIKGPGSAMYGAGLGGIVKLKAGYPSRIGFSYTLGINRASFNTQKITLQTAWKNNSGAIGIAYSGVSSDGFRENNQYNRKQLFIHGKTGSKKNQFTFNVLATDLYAEIPSSLNKNDFLNEPTKAAANWLAIQGFETYFKVSAGIGWTRMLNENLNNHMVVFSSVNNPYESRPFNILDDQSFLGGLRNFISYERNSMKIQSGFELFSENYGWKIFETISGQPGTEQLFNKETRSYGNLFSHLRWQTGKKYTIEAGLNFNLLQYMIHTEYHIDGTDQSGEYSYKPVISPRIGVNYIVSPGQFLHASAGHGFSAPSLEETLLPEGLVNPSLLPESGWNLDAGLRGWLINKRWYYDASVYAIFIRNMLVTKRISEDTFTGINAGAVLLSGIELYNKFLLNKQLHPGSWKGSVYTSIFLNKNRFTDFVDDGVDQSGNALPAIPGQTLLAGINAEYKEKLQFIVETRYTGIQYLNDANTENIPAYTIANIKTSYRISRPKLSFSIRLNAGINNLFNTLYASMILVNAPSFGSALPRYYYPGMPRNYFFAVYLEHK